MKYIKLYEDLDKPKEGDYVYCEDNTSVKVNEFIKDKIGQILFITPFNDFLLGVENSYQVTYDNIPKLLTKYMNAFNYKFSQTTLTRTFFIDDIKYWADSKEKLEIKKDSDKYNL